jgi:DNA-binding transcriptional regulator YhcF (GntR family)
MGKRFITINLESPIPVYRQIVDAIRHLLVEGELRPGDQLPPVRQVGLDLGVHFNTVAQAYRELADEGWLELKRRRGALVLDRAQPRTPSKTRQNQSFKKLRELTAQLLAEGIPANEIVNHLRKLADGMEGHRT